MKITFQVPRNFHVCLMRRHASNDDELCDISIRTLKLIFFSVTAAPLPLAELCRRRIRISLGKKRLNQVEELPLPRLLHDYVLYR